MRLKWTVRSSREDGRHCNLQRLHCSLNCWNTKQEWCFRITQVLLGNCLCSFVFLGRRILARHGRSSTAGHVFLLRLCGKWKWCWRLARIFLLKTLEMSKHCFLLWWSIQAQKFYHLMSACTCRCLAVEGLLFSGSNCRCRWWIIEKALHFRCWNWLTNADETFRQACCRQRHQKPLLLLYGTTGLNTVISAKNQRSRSILSSVDWHLASGFNSDLIFCWLLDWHLAWLFLCVIP